MKRSTLIVGGGLAGLTAGIYALKYGFDVTIIEKNAKPGGLCTGWKRQGYTIDNCLHWMTGTSPRNPLNEIHREIRTITDSVPLLQRDVMHRHDYKDDSLYFYKDPVKLENELLRVAPEDAREIHRFVRLVCDYRDGEMVPVKPFEQMGIIDYCHLLFRMWPVIKHHLRYSHTSLQKYSERFKSPVLRHFLTSYLPKEYFAEAIFYTYGTFACGDGDIPMGGSEAAAQRILDRFTELGGVFKPNSAARRFIIDKSSREITGVELADGKIMSADYYIAACDTYVTFNTLLPSEYKDKFFTKRYNDPDKYPVFSNFITYLSIPSRIVQGEPDIITIDSGVFTSLLLKHYAYEPEFAPQGRTILQVLLISKDEEYNYWERLYKKDKNTYDKCKNALARKIQESIDRHFKLQEGESEIIEALTPYSLNRWCGSYKGSYMSFVPTSKAPIGNHLGRIKGLGNFLLASQWQTSPGGTPNAIQSGKYAADRLRKMARK